MDTIEKTTVAYKNVSNEISDEKFKPKGAIAFFVVLMLICAVIWFGIYYMQLTR